MGHIPDDENFEEFMDASAESWSKSDEPDTKPEQEEPSDRWGSPVQDEESASDPERWGSEPVKPAATDFETPAKKSGSRWWIIAIVVLVVLCLCLCIGFFALSALGVAGPWMNFNF